MTTNETTILTGLDAIDHATQEGLLLNKYADPTEGPREGLSVAEALEIAAEDASLIWVEVAPAMTISSQRYLDDETVAAKLAANDYEVEVFGVVVGGQAYRVVVDGHHSLAAARQAGVEPVWVEVERAVASEYASEIDEAGVHAWLDNHQVDSDWYNIETGLQVF